MTNSIQKFFLMCSGCDLAILKRDECAIEQNKYLGIGATILSTAVLASLSGGYAMYTVFQSVYLAIFFGVLWGAIILNLDRYIVSSLRKSDLSGALTPKQRATLRLNEVFTALPRLALAILISIVITKPIELRLFKGEIDGVIAQDRIREAVDIRQSAAHEFAEIGKLETDNKSLTGQIRDKEKERYDAEQQKFAELDGWGGSRRPGDGPIHKEKQRAFARVDSELKDLKRANEPLIKRNEERIALIRPQMETRINQTQSTSEGANGLLKRLETLSAIAREHFSVEVANAFIILLFIMLETAPIFVKLLSQRGPYDEIYDSLEHEVRAREQKKRFEVDDQMSTDLSLNNNMRARQLAAELELSRRTMASLETLAGPEILEAQLEIARLITAEWKRAELQKLRFIAPTRPSGNGGGGGESRATTPNLSQTGPPDAETRRTP